MNVLLPYTLQSNFSFSCVGNNDTDLPLQTSLDNIILAVLDVSGYTSITHDFILTAEKEMHDGKNASQWIGQFMRKAMDPVFTLIYGSGGDIVQFGGDSIICIWPSTTIVANVVRTCLETFKVVESIEIPFTDSLKKKLTLHGVVHRCPQSQLIGLMCNQTKDASLLLLGDSVAFAFDLLNSTGRGNLAVTPAISSKDELPANIQLKQGSGGHIFLNTTYLKYFQKNNPTEPNPFNTSDKKMVPDPQMKPVMLQQNESSFMWFLDKSARYKSRNKSDDELWSVSVLFVRFVISDSDINLLQQLFNEVCMIVSEFKGIMKQLTRDDKGITALVLFGLPPETIENPCIPAIKAAAQIIKNTSKIGQTGAAIEHYVGISSGRVYSGFIGPAVKRMEHALLGEAINIAARIMSSPLSKAGILCDETTFQSSRQLLRFSSLTAHTIKVKGIPDPINVFPVDLNKIYLTTNPFHDSLSNIYASSFPESKCFRNTTKDWEQLVDTWMKSGKSQILVLEGPSGSGKSHVASTILKSSKTENSIMWYWPSFEFEAQVPLHIFKSLLPDLERFMRALSESDSKYSTLKDFQTSNQTSDKKSEDFIEKGLSILSATDPCVLQSIRELAKKLPENGRKKDPIPRNQSSSYSLASESSSLGDDAESLQETLSIGIAKVIHAIAQLKKLVIVMDDCHWQDFCSQSIVFNILIWLQQAKSDNILFLYISRPEIEYQGSDQKHLYKRIKDIATIIEMRTISKEQIVERLCEELSVTPYQVSQISSLIYQRTQGNAFALSVFLGPVIENLKNMQIPDWSNLDVGNIVPLSPISVASAKFEKLDASFKEFLRIAALMGQSFNFKDVSRLANLSTFTDVSQILDHDKFGFLVLVKSNNFMFRHCLIQQQIVDIMIDEQKCLYYGKICDYYRNEMEKRYRPKNEVLPFLYRSAMLSKNTALSFEYGVKIIKLYSEYDMPTDIVRTHRELRGEKGYKESQPYKWGKMQMLSAKAYFDLSDVKEACKCYYEGLRAFGLPVSNFKIVRLFSALYRIVSIKRYYENGKPLSALYKVALKGKTVKILKWITFCSNVVSFGVGTFSPLDSLFITTLTAYLLISHKDHDKDIFLDIDKSSVIPAYTGLLYIFRVGLGDSTIAAKNMAKELGCKYSPLDIKYSFENDPSINPFLGKGTGERNMLSLTSSVLLGNLILWDYKHCYSFIKLGMDFADRCNRKSIYGASVCALPMVASALMITEDLDNIPHIACKLMNWHLEDAVTPVSRLNRLIFCGGALAVLNQKNLLNDPTLAKCYQYMVDQCQQVINLNHKSTQVVEDIDAALGLICHASNTRNTKLFQNSIDFLLQSCKRTDKNTVAFVLIPRMHHFLQLTYSSILQGKEFPVDILKCHIRFWVKCRKSFLFTLNWPEFPDHEVIYYYSLAMINWIGATVQGKPFDDTISRNIDAALAVFKTQAGSFNPLVENILHDIKSRIETLSFLNLYRKQ